MRAKEMKKVVAVVIVMALLVSGTVVPGSAKAAGKVKLNKTKVSIAAGKTVQLKLKNAKKKVKWSSANKKIAIVSKKGKVTGKKAGKVKITARSAGKKYICRVTVIKSNGGNGDSGPSATVRPGSTKSPVPSTAKPGTTQKPSSTAKPGNTNTPGTGGSSIPSSQVRPASSGEDTLTVGNLSVKLGMSKSEVESSVGAKADREEKTPLGFDAYIYNPSADYTNYLMVQFDNDSVVGMSTISSYFCYEGLFSAGDSFDDLRGKGFKSMNSTYDYEAGYLYESGNEYAMAFVDHQGDHTVYAAQIFSKVKQLDDLFKAENLTYDNTINSNMAKQLFDWVNAFRGYKGVPLAVYCDNDTAQKHSEDMALSGSVQMDSSDGTSWKQRFNNNYKSIVGLWEEDTLGMSENIASRSPDAFGFVTWWADDTSGDKSTTGKTKIYENMCKSAALYNGIEEPIDAYYLCTGFAYNESQTQKTFATLDFFF